MINDKEDDVNAREAQTQCDLMMSAFARRDRRRVYTHLVLATVCFTILNIGVFFLMPAWTHTTLSFSLGIVLHRVWMHIYGWVYER